MALARSLVLEPKILLLDEPFASLDQHLRERLREEVRDIQQRLKITTLFVTHGQDEALAMADRIVVMRDGRIEQIAAPDMLYREPATPFVAGFIGKMNLIEGTVADGTFSHAAFAIPLPVADGPVIFAVRPEALGIAPGRPVGLRQGPSRHRLWRARHRRSRTGRRHAPEGAGARGARLARRAAGRSQAARLCRLPRQPGHLSVERSA